MPQESRRALAPEQAASLSHQLDTAALNAWRAGAIVELARTEACDNAPIGGIATGERWRAHMERVDAILAGAAALLRELHGELRRADDRICGRD